MFRKALLLAALLPLVSSCVAVVAAGVVAASAVQYHRNELEQDFGTDLEETWGATLEALERLGIALDELELEATEGRIEHEDMTLVVERHPEGFTRVRVSIGTFHTSDHERRAELVLQEISASIEGRDELRAWVEKTSGTAPPEEVEPVSPHP